MSHQLDYAFRLVHIKNIPHILEAGFVLPSSPKASHNFISIGDDVVMSKRNMMQNNGGIDLSDYIPF